MDKIIKYPRTPHLYGSHVHDDDKVISEDKSLSLIQNTSLVIEEKVDGSNVGIFFTKSKLYIQSRGHILRGNDHPSFDMFKAWVFSKTDILNSILKDRYIMYGEWLYAVHTLRYNRLPHYFLEFDILDKKHMKFLSTNKRQSLLADSGIQSVPVLHKGALKSMKQLVLLITTSNFGGEPMEGMYLKIEEDGYVTDRCKFVRKEFLMSAANRGKLWKENQIETQQLAPGINIYDS